MASQKQQLLLLLVVCGLSFFTRLGAPRLWDRDEPRNARCACEMAERRDWVVPTFNGELRAHKPVLLYWLIMSAYAVFGVSEFAARFWSALLAGGTTIVTYWIGCRLFDTRAATWAAFILATTLMFNVAAHAATPDSALIFCSTLALGCLMRVSLPRDGDASAHGPLLDPEADARAAQATIAHVPGNRRWAIAAGAAMGAGVLAKGPIGFALPVAVWIAFELLTACRLPSAESPPIRVWRQMRTRLFDLTLVTATTLLVAAPWYVLVGLRTDGAWLREFFLEHHVSRAMSPMEGHGGNPFVYYPIAILVGFFPWSALAIPTGLWVARQRVAARFDARFAWLLIWTGVYVAAFSLAGTKLPNYVTPTYPALALMAGHFVAHWPLASCGPARWWPRASAATLILVGLVITTALPWLAQRYLPEEQPLAAVGLVLLVGGIACEWNFLRCQMAAGLRRMAFTALVFIVALFGWAAPRVSQHQRIEQLLLTARAFDPQAPIASWDVHEPSWVFYAGQSVPLLQDTDTEKALKLLQRRQGFLITSGSHYERLKERIGTLGVIHDEVPYFLRNDDLILIGPSADVGQRVSRR